MKKTSSVPIAGVYLLHFTKPFGRARHYIGWSPDIYKRVSRHKEGKGAKFTMGALRHGADLLLVRIWPGGDRRLEWELKHKGTHQALCALCSPLPARLFISGAAAGAALNSKVSSSDGA
jgi:predicted GIY-YIG superfamily endonuclease